MNLARAMMSKPSYERSPEACLWYAVATQCVEDITAAYRRRDRAELDGSAQSGPWLNEPTTRSAIRTLFCSSFCSDLMLASGVPILAAQKGLRVLAERSGLLLELDDIVNQYADR